MSQTTATPEPPRCESVMPRTNPPNLWRCDLPAGHADEWHRHTTNDDSGAWVAWHRREDNPAFKAATEWAERPLVAPPRTSP